MLPWDEQKTPLMLAPMQGLTNRGLRAVYGAREEVARPDVLFTEFVRVRPEAKSVIADSDYLEATTEVPGVPLVVQVIGAPGEVTEPVRDLVARGVRHINVNMGCPWGRMTSVLAGGGMFRHPETVAPMLEELRAIVPGSLSVKTRAGLEEEREIFAVLPAMERAGVDFLVVHPRTVAQKYKGAANHALTREIVGATSMRVIANGDVRDAADAARALEETGAAGLMVGRGAIRDPGLFARIRGASGPRPEGEALRAELAAHLAALLERYRELFHGDAQVLFKLREVLAQIDDEDQRKWLKKLRKAKRVDEAAAVLS